MTAAAASLGRLDGPGAMRSRLLILGVDACVTGVTAAVLTLGLVGRPPSGPLIIVLPSTLAIFALLVYLSLAFANSERARWSLPALLLLATLVYIPASLLGWTAAYMQAPLMAAAGMSLPRRAGFIAFFVPVVGTDIFYLLTFAGRVPAHMLAYGVVYQTTGLLLSGAALFSAPLLARTVRLLQSTRAELAALATHRERLRVSRDVHDLLGQSLSAISLKGDLAIELLEHDASAAVAEIRGMTDVARDALRGMRAVMHNEPLVSLRTEVEGAAALLKAAGIDCDVKVESPSLPKTVEEVLSWAVREGVTNVLRHSNATWCSISSKGDGSHISVEIINDGARGSIGQGSGLSGLTERARALAGSVRAGQIQGDRFRLVVDVPVRVA